MTLYESIGQFFSPIFTQFFSQIVLAVIVLLIGFIIGRIFGKLLEKILHEAMLDKTLERSLHRKLYAEEILGMVLMYFIYFVAVVIALNELGLTKTILFILSVAIIIVITASALLSIKDLMPNAVAGFYLAHKKLFRIGERIRYNGVEGKIASMKLTELELETANHDRIYIPNAVLMRSEVIKLKK